MVGKTKYGKGSLRIWRIRERGYGEEIRRVERMDGGEGGGSKNDNWRGLHRKDRERGRRGEEEGKERERNSKDSKKRKANVGKRG